MTIRYITLLGLFILACSTHASEKDGWYTKAVKSVLASVEPSEAKKGQTVTFKLTVQLNDGYFTYPLSQPEESAKSMINRIVFPKPGTLIFVDSVKDPKNFLTKEEPTLGIFELRTYKGSVTFERKAVVSPNAKSGEAKVSIDSFKLSVCDANNCFPAKTLQPSATLKILNETVDVEKLYLGEVKKALESK